MRIQNLLKKFLFILPLLFLGLTSFAQSTDLVIQKTGPNTKYLGEDMTYTIVITNNGPSAADGATFQDILPEYVFNVSWGGCTASGGAACPTASDYTFTTVNIGGVDRVQLDGTIPTLPDGGEIEFILNLQAPSAEYSGSSFSNTATVLPPSGAIDTDNSTNSSTWNVTLLKDIDLETTYTAALSNSDCSTFPKTIDYTLTFTNNGPSNGKGAALVTSLFFFKDNFVGSGDAVYSFPWEIQNLTWNVSGAGMTAPTVQFDNMSGVKPAERWHHTTYLLARLRASGTEGTAIENWPSGESITLTFTLYIDEPSSVTGCGQSMDISIRNMSSVSGVGNITETDSSNNGIDDTVSFGTCVSDVCPEIDLQSTSSSVLSSDDCMTFPKTIDYTITWTNNGPSNGQGARLLNSLYIYEQNEVGGGDVVYTFPWEIQNLTWSVSDPGMTAPTVQFDYMSGSETVIRDYQTSTSLFAQLHAYNTNAMGDWPAGETVTLTFSLIIDTPSSTGCGQDMDIQIRSASNVGFTSGDIVDTTPTNNTVYDNNLLNDCNSSACPEIDLEISTANSVVSDNDCNTFPKTIDYTVVWTNNGPSNGQGATLHQELHMYNQNVEGTGNTVHAFPWEIQNLSWSVSGAGMTAPSSQFDLMSGTESVTYSSANNASRLARLNPYSYDAIGDWPSGEMVTLTFSLIINEPTTTGCGKSADIEVRNFSSVNESTGIVETNTANDRVYDYASFVMESNDLAISKNVTPAIVNPGDNFTMELTFQNSPSSGGDATDVYWLDTIPTSVTIDVSSISCVPLGGAICPTVTYDPVTRIMRQDFASMPRGGQVVITYLAEATPPFTLTDETKAYAINQCEDCLPATNFTQSNFQVQGLGSNSLGSFVWLDTNNNGVQDIDESGIPNIRIDLYDTNDVLMGSMMTDPMGNYLFEDLKNGIYYIKIGNMPTNHSLVSVDSGTNDEIDSDVDPVSGKSITYNLNGNVDELSVDVGLAVDQLPVEMIYFNGFEKNCVVVLNWATATEEMNDYFLVQKSTDGMNFSTIGRVGGAGNTADRQDYSFADKNITDDKNYYRLKQVDWDGKYEYSHVIVLSSDRNSHCLNIFGKARVYPNPSQGDVKFEVHLQETTNNIRLTTLDILGKQIDHFEYDLNKGDQIISLNLQDYQEGTYFIKANYNNGSEAVFKIIIID